MGGHAGPASMESGRHPRSASLRYPPAELAGIPCNSDFGSFSSGDIFLGTLSRGLSLAREGTATLGQKLPPLECVLPRPLPDGPGDWGALGTQPSLQGVWSGPGRVVRPGLGAT